MTVIILSGVRGDTQRYRTFHPYEALRLAGVACELSHVTDPELPARFERARVAVLHRVAHDPYVERLLSGARARGAVVIGDVDDLVFEPDAFRWIDSPDFQDPLRTALYQDEMRRYRAALDACHAVTTSTEFLAGRVSALGKPSWVQRNGFSLEMLGLSDTAFERRPANSGRVILGYASGTPTHDRDFEAAKPALKRILGRYPQAGLLLVGPLNPGDDWGEAASRVRRQKRLPWRQLPGLQAGFDVNLAPLVTDNPFSQSKSEIKYMEAALVRVPTAASPTGAFAHAIREGDNGFLSASEEEWYDCLSRLIEDPDLRREMGQRAYEDVLDRYHPAARAVELIDTINQIHFSVHQKPLWDEVELEQMRSRLEEQNRPHGAIPADSQAARPPSLARMALYSLRHRGARTMFLQARVYLRRLAVPIFPYPSGRGSAG